MKKDERPKAPVPASKARSVLESEGGAPEPDDDTPTQPDIRPPCPRCGSKDDSVERKKCPPCQRSASAERK